MINCGLIGVGKFGKNILKNLKRHKAIKKIYLCDTNISTNKTFESFPVTPDYKTILKNPDIKSVFIATPSYTHYDIIIDAIKADKHVFCEKPICGTFNELSHIYNINKTYNKYIYCDYTFCYSNMINEFKQIMYLHNFHCVSNIDISWHSTNIEDKNIETYIDVIRDLAVHCLSILMFLYNNNDIIITNVDNLYDNNIIIKSTIYATIANNRCTINVSWNNCHKERTIHIYDSNQRLLLDFIKQKIVVSNKIEQEYNLLDKEEPLFNSISWFIDSTLQKDDIFYKNHMNVNIQIMYIIQQILNFNKRVKV